MRVGRCGVLVPTGLAAAIPLRVPAVPRSNDSDAILRASLYGKAAGCLQGQYLGPPEGLPEQRWNL